MITFLVIASILGGLFIVGSLYLLIKLAVKDVIDGEADGE